MANFEIYALGASRITVSNGVSLSGFTQGDASQLDGQTITLDANAWQPISLKDNEQRFADNDGGQRFRGSQDFDGRSYGNNSIVEAEYTVVVSDGTTEYTLVGFNIRESGSPFPSYGTVEGLAFVDVFPPVGVPLTVVSTSEGPPNAGAGALDASEYATPPCFASGTLIETPSGAVPVERLRAGDRVTTRDRGPARLVWTGEVAIGPRRLAATPSLRPVRIRAGAFGDALPARDLLVSQQHRIVLSGHGVSLATGEEEVMAAAVHLVDGDRITIDDAARSVTYHHLLFDRHEVVLSEGLETESFLPGPAVMPSMAPDARAELLNLFPELAFGMPARLAAARPILRGFEARALAA